MAEEHHLSLEGRQRLRVTGVSEVVSFEEDGAALRTAEGLLLVQGTGLQLKLLSPDGGQVALEGLISALSYQEPRREGSFLSRLFR